VLLNSKNEMQAVLVTTEAYVNSWKARTTKLE